MYTNIFQNYITAKFEGTMIVHILYRHMCVDNQVKRK